jgi:hypothetical protein
VMIWGESFISDTEQARNNIQNSVIMII